MRIVYKINLSSGAYMGKVMFEGDMPDDPSYITIQPPNGMVLPTWDGNKWVSESVLDEEASAPPPTLEERLYAMEAAMLEVGEIIAGGGA